MFPWVTCGLRGYGPLSKFESTMMKISHLGIELDIERETVLGGGDVVGEIRESKLVRHG